MSTPPGARATQGPGGRPPGTDVRALVPVLLRGYPPVLGAMLLVEGVITLILGGDATISLGEVVAYLLLPPLAMYLVTQFTGGRRPGAVAIGAAVGGGVVLLLALFLGGGVHLLTLPGWALVVVGLLMLGVAVFVMRLSAPAPEENVAPLLSQSERDGFSRSDDEYDEYGIPTGRRDDRDEYASNGGGDHGSARHSAPADGYGTRDEYGPAQPGGDYGDYGDHRDHGAAQGGYGDHDRSADFDWPPARRDEAPGYQAGHSADHATAADGSYAAATGPSEPEWPPRRPTHSAGPAEMDWSDQPAPSAQPHWSRGPADRDWPPAQSVEEWPPRSGTEPTRPAHDGGPHSWFEPEPEPGGPAGPTNREWPPANPDASGGRRTRYPDR